MVDPLVIEDASIPVLSPEFLKEDEVSLIIGLRVGGLFGGVALEAELGFNLIV